MGTSSTPRELASKLERMAISIQRHSVEATKEAAKATKTALLAEAAIAVGADLRLSRVGKKGARIGAGYEVEELPGNQARSTIKPRGPWALVEYSIRPHVITPRRSRKRGKAQRARTVRTTIGNASFDQQRPATSGRSALPALSTPFGFRRSVNHPGVKMPKKPWAKGYARVRPTIPRYYQNALGAALEEVF